MLDMDICRQVGALAGSALDSQVSDAQRLLTWGPTWVVAMSAQRLGRVVFKASGAHDVAAEAWVCRRAASVGVSTAQVVATGSDASVPGGVWVVMTELGGRRWDELPPSRVRDEGVVEQLGQVFAALHSVRLDGFGPLDRTGTGTAASWEGWLSQSMHKSVGELLGHGAKGLGGLVTAALQRRAVELASRPGCLVHGDLGDGEVFVDGDGLLGVVDWGSAMVADPVHDFARFVAGGPVDDPRPARLLPGLMTSYRHHAGRDPGKYAGLLDLYRAQNALVNAVWSVHEGLFDWTEPLVDQAWQLLSSSA